MRCDIHLKTHLVLFLSFGSFCGPVLSLVEEIRDSICCDCLCFFWISLWILTFIQAIRWPFSPWYCWLKGDLPRTYPSSCKPKEKIMIVGHATGLVTHNWFSLVFWLPWLFKLKMPGMTLQYLLAWIVDVHIAFSIFQCHGFATNLTTGVGWNTGYHTWIEKGNLVCCTSLRVHIFAKTWKLLWWKRVLRAALDSVVASIIKHRQRYSN